MRRFPSPPARTSPKIEDRRRRTIAARWRIAPAARKPEVATRAAGRLRARRRRAAPPAPPPPGPAGGAPRRPTARFTVDEGCNLVADAELEAAARRERRDHS